MAKAKPRSKFKNKLNEVIDLARCMLGSLEDTKEVTSDRFSDDLIRQLNQSIYHAETLLAPLKNPRAGLVAEIFYQLGVLIGAAEAQIFSLYTWSDQGPKKPRREERWPTRNLSKIRTPSPKTLLPLTSQTLSQSRNCT